MSLLQYLFNACGLLYSGLLLLSLVGGLAGGVLLMMIPMPAKSRLVLMVGLALLPLVFGLIGTAHGYANIRQILQYVDSPVIDSEELELSYATAWITTYLGLGISGLLGAFSVVVCLFGAKSTAKTAQAS